MLVDQQVGTPVAGDRQEVRGHGRGEGLAEHPREDEGGPLRRRDLRRRAQHTAPQPCELCRFRAAGHGRNSRDLRQGLGPRRPEHVVPGRHERAGERQHREDVANAVRRGEKDAHGPSMALSAGAGARPRLRSTPRMDHACMRSVICVLRTRGPSDTSRGPARHTAAMGLLDSWTLGDHSASGVRHPTYRKGSGPGVIVIHEIPGLTPSVIGFGEELVAAGYTVVMPHLFGEPERPMNPLTVASSLRPGLRLARSSPSWRPVRPRPSPAGCARWPESCTPSWAAPGWGPSACASRAVSRWP